jgi:transposase
LSIKGRTLVLIAREVFALVKGLAKGLIGKCLFRRRIEKSKKELAYILKAIVRLSGLPQAVGVARNLLKSYGMMWRFIEKEGVEMTNNLAERQIRKYVLYRKKLLFTWSSWGNLFIERIMSLFLSCNLAGKILSLPFPMLSITRRERVQTVKQMNPF